MVARRIRFAVWWRRAGVGLRVLVFIVGAALLGTLVYVQSPEANPDNLPNNLLVFILVNLNIIILCVLVFLIGRNVVRLFFDRRRRILGSKLRMRLVVAFVGLTLIPTAFLFVLASGLLTNAMEGWFSSQIEGSVNGAVQVAKVHYAALKDHTSAQTVKSVDEVLQGLLAKKNLGIALEEIRKKEELFSIKVLNDSEGLQAEAHSAIAEIDAFQEPPLSRDALSRAIRGDTSTLLEEKDSAQFMRGYAPLLLGGERHVLVTSSRVNPELSHSLSMVTDSFKEYEQLKLFKQPLKSGYLLTLSMITGLILFSAIWIGFYIAREITGPIQRLAEGMTAVAHGNFNIQLRIPGDDELGVLVRAFNTMASELKSSRQELDARRRYTETILSNLVVGVIGIDAERRITSVNASAERLLGLPPSKEAMGKELSTVLPRENFEQIADILMDGPPEEDDVREKEIHIRSNGAEHKVICTAGILADSDGEDTGKVLLFDDVTELARAQQMSAWREVARRIAHEIKNPLTPIQLSAQRLSRLFAGNTEQGSAVQECADTIVEHVDSIKRLADEFSNFARMPTAEFQLANLNDLVTDTVSPFAETNSDIVFQCISDTKVPDCMIDREQLRRVLINIIDNSIFALRSIPEDAEGRRITVRCMYDRRRRLVRLEISDNGPGIRASDKAKIFEPYFTTKATGTGLGLAIVNSIINDHQGSIHVYDNNPRGAKFIVELPLAPRHTTQRRFATV